MRIKDSCKNVRERVIAWVIDLLHFIPYVIIKLNGIEVFEVSVSDYLGFSFYELSF